MSVASNFLKGIARIVVPKTVVVGVDVQDTRVALFATISDSHTGKRVVSAAEALAPGIVTGGEIKNPDVFFDVIAKLMERVATSRYTTEPIIVLSISPVHMYSELSLFPLMQAPNLAEAVRLRVETSLPWPLDSAYVDSHTVPMNDTHKAAVFIAGIEKRILDPYFEVFRRGGWRIAVCEFHLLSLAHSMSPVQQGAEKGVRLLILIDDDCIEFGIFSNLELIAHVNRKFEGSDDPQAKIGFEIRRLLAYAETEIGSKIESILLFDKKGIEAEIEKLHEEIHVPTQFLSLSENPAFAVAFGASSRGLSYQNHDINFAPMGSGGRYEENLIVRTLGFWKNAIIIFCAAMLAVSVGFYIFLNGEKHPLVAETKQLKNTLGIQVQQAQPLLDRVSGFNELATTAAKAGSERRRVAAVVAVLVDAASQTKVKILGVGKDQVEKPLLRIQAYAPTRDAMIDFKNKLEAATRPSATLEEISRELSVETSAASVSGAVKYFSAVRIPVLELAKETDLTVTIEAEYNE
jgi:hypothetical protein